MSDGAMLFDLLGVHKENSDKHVYLPMAESVENRVGGMHASAQFALAEMGCIDFLRQQFPEFENGALVLVRRAEIKFSKAVDTTLLAYPYLDGVDSDRVNHEYHSKGRVIVPVNVKLKTQAGEVATHAVYHWIVTRR